MHKVTLIKGDGIGPEVMDSAKKIVEAARVKIEWLEKPAGKNALETHESPLPSETIDSIKETKIALKGPATTPVGKGFRSINVQLRKELDLYAGLRPVKSIPGIKTRFENVDLVIVRENTEGLYSGIEFENGTDTQKNIASLVKQELGRNIDDSTISLKVVSPKATNRIIKFAFDYAVKHKRKEVTVVHKANILKFGDGFFLKQFREISKLYPQVKNRDLIIDNCCMQLALKPENYDVMVLPNLYGDIVSDLAAGLVGGLGVIPGANIGEKYAVFESVHGSAPDIAGKNIANPTAAIQTAIMMLKYIGENNAAKRIENALFEVLKEGKNVTKDINPNGVGTTQMTKAIIDKL